MTPPVRPARARTLFESPVFFCRCSCASRFHITRQVEAVHLNFSVSCVSGLVWSSLDSEVHIICYGLTRYLLSSSSRSLWYPVPLFLILEASPLVPRSLIPCGLSKRLPLFNDFPGFQFSVNV